MLVFISQSILVKAISMFMVLEEDQAAPPTKIVRAMIARGLNIYLLRHK